MSSGGPVGLLRRALRLDRETTHSRASTSTTPTLSVIVPTLNEERNVARAIRSTGDGPLEVIVVDGGSSDRTVEFARACGATVMSCAKGRGIQLNVGARAARGELLLFLHADSALPSRYFDSILMELKRRRGLRHKLPVWGCFEHITVEAKGLGLRFMERVVAARTRLLSLPYGDQALFVKASTYHALGGFKEWPLLEDYEMVLKLRKVSPPALVQPPLSVHGRRWLKLGLLQNTLLNQFILAAYHLGVEPHTLASWYYCYCDPTAPLRVPHDRAKDRP